MNTRLAFYFLLTFFYLPLSATVEDTSAIDTGAINSLIRRHAAIKYQTGKIDISSDINLDVPKGFKYMKKEDAEYIVFDYWGNPKSDGILGIIVKEDYQSLDENGWAFVVTYDKSGYVKDEDADKLDYDQMLKDLKESEIDENKEREKEGYGPIHTLGWATKPFYDKSNNILHWAKSLRFSDSEDTTLNYDVRILGRKGVLSLNAVGTIDQLADIKSSIPEIIHIAKFNKGSSYLDFDPSVDEVAAYTIGGLVAGKLLAKAGILALLLKNIKFIIIGIVALFSVFKNKILGLFGKGKKEETSVPNTETDTTE